MNQNFYNQLWPQTKPAQECTELPQGNAPQNCIGIQETRMESNMRDESALSAERAEIRQIDNMRKEFVRSINQIPSELLTRTLKDGGQPLTKLTLLTLIYWKLVHLVLDPQKAKESSHLGDYVSLVPGYCFIQAIYIYITQDLSMTDVTSIKAILKSKINDQTLSPFVRKSIGIALSCPENGFPVKWLPFPYVVFTGQDVKDYMWIIYKEHIYFNPFGMLLQGPEKLDPDTKLGKGGSQKKKHVQKGKVNNNKKLTKKEKAIKQEIKRVERKVNTVAAHRPNTSKGPRSWLNKGLQVVGNMAGSYFGMPTAGNMIFGKGDYQMNAGVKTNSLIHPVAPGGPPKFRAQKHSTVISRKEYLGDIMGNAGFSYKTYTVQPTDSTTFPWLSQIARNYRTYRFTGLVFYFESMSGGMVSTTPSLGQVGMLSSRIGTPLPSNKLSFESNNNVVNTSPDKSLAYGIECDKRELETENFLVRVPGVTGVSDDKIDMCKLQVYVNATPTTTFLGELWVTYTVVLDEPYEYIEYSGQVDKYYVASPGSTLFPTSTTLPNAGSNLGTSVVNNTVQLNEGVQAGYYSITIYLQLNSAAASIPNISFTVGSNVLKINAFSSNSVSSLSSPYGGTSACRNSSFTCIVQKLDDKSANIVISGMSSTVGVIDMLVQQIPNAIFNPPTETLVPNRHQTATELTIAKDTRQKQLLEKQDKLNKSFDIRSQMDKSIDYHAESDDEEIDDHQTLAFMKTFAKMMRSLTGKKQTADSTSLLE